MLSIAINSIHGLQQRYPTVGDWTNSEDMTQRNIAVTEMGNVDYEFLVALHEMIEQHLCLKRGITMQQVDKFDLLFEAERKDGMHGISAEPGDDERAPYRREHRLATMVEQLVAYELGIDWETYQKACAA